MRIMAVEERNQLIAAARQLVTSEATAFALGRILAISEYIDYIEEMLAANEFGFSLEFQRLVTVGFDSGVYLSSGIEPVHG